MLKCPECENELVDEKSCPCGWRYKRSDQPLFVRTCCRCQKLINDGEYFRMLKSSQKSICDSCLHPFERDWRDQLVDDYMKNHPIGVTHTREEHADFMDVVKSYSKTQDRKRAERLKRERQRYQPEYDDQELINQVSVPEVNHG